MKLLLSRILSERKLSGELLRVEKLFKHSFKSFLGSRSRDVKLDFMEKIIKDTLSKNDVKFLILRLQKRQSKKE
jgi:hypothetical protein